MLFLVLLGFYMYLPSTQTATVIIIADVHSVYTYLTNDMHETACACMYNCDSHVTIPCSFGTFHLSLLILHELAGVVSSGVEVTSP